MKMTMKNPDTLTTLHGWGDFMRKSGRTVNADTVKIFGAVMCNSADSRRSGKTEVASAIDFIGGYLVEDCVKAGVPLWPALIFDQPSTINHQPGKAVR